MFIKIIAIILFIIVIILKFMSLSIGKKIFSVLTMNDSIKKDVAFNLRTIVLSEEKISRVPFEAQADIRKKKIIDQLFFVFFIITFILFFIISI